MPPRPTEVHPPSASAAVHGTGKELSGFQKFILRGNVVDLAVAVVLGAAFGAVVTGFVSSFITPLIAAIGGEPDFAALTFTVNNSEFGYGAFINSLISFLIIALVIFFLVIKPVNTLMAKVSPPAAGAEPAICPEWFSLISPDANRCPHCTTWLRGPSVAIS